MADRIILVRHGRPDLATRGMLSCSGFRQWCEDYDQAGVVEDPDMPDAIRKLLHTGETHCSDLPRAIDSARALGASSLCINPLFREAGLPVLILPLVRLPVGMWLILARLLWMLGYQRHCESGPDFDARVDEAARLLQQAVEQQGLVVLVGHGFFLHRLAARLTRGGQNPAERRWRRLERHGGSFWGVQVMQRTHL